MGLTIPKQLRQYQSKRRKETEDKIIIHLLKDVELGSSRKIWSQTRVSKNSLLSILTKLVKQNKIIKFENIKITQIIHYKDGSIARRIVTRTIYLPNICHPYVFNLIKKNLRHFFYTTGRKWTRKGAKLYIKNKGLSKKKLSLVLNSFARDRGHDVSYHPLKSSGELEIIYAHKIGQSLLCLCNELKLLPERPPTVKELDSRLSRVSK